jgi:hypothetical protein
VEGKSDLAENQYYFQDEENTFNLESFRSTSAQIIRGLFFDAYKMHKFTGNEICE